ncbi:unnamed protein product [Brassica oleracea var. botrytis]
MEVVSKCMEATATLNKCMDVHSYYYQPILPPERAAEEGSCEFKFVHLPICFLCGISELISPFQAEQQMEANFSGSSSTSRQIQKIDVGGRLIKGILRRSEMAQPDFIFCTA